MILIVIVFLKVSHYLFTRLLLYFIFYIFILVIHLLFYQCHVITLYTLDPVNTFIIRGSPISIILMVSFWVSSPHWIYVLSVFFFFCGEINKLNGSFRLSKQGLIVTLHSKQKINKRNKLYKHKRGKTIRRLTLKIYSYMKKYLNTW